ncbi:hypothetical protein [Deferrisoma palaeochoriense]
MAVAVFCVLVIGLLVLTAAPLFGPRKVLAASGDARRQRLEALEQEKKGYLKAIKDVEFERATGKISEEDFQELREFYALKAAEAMDALERLEQEARGGRKRG